MAQLNARVETVLDQAGESDMSVADSESSYHLLGAFREVSAALLDFMQHSVPIDWRRLQEARF